MLQPVRPLDVDLAQLFGGKFTPGARVIGADPTASFELPGPFPGKIAHVGADGALTTLEGRLMADAPLRFVRDGDLVRAWSFDGNLSYQAAERVTAAAAWSPTPAGAGCCGWWEHTLWRAAPGALEAGLLRAVTPPTQEWSVIDLHRPASPEPRWRVLLTEGQRAVVAAAMSPRADQLVLVAVAADGSASVQARRVDDGELTWSTNLGSPAAAWRRGESRLVYSQDGARVAVLVEAPQRCESCTAIEVFETARGTRLQRVELETIIAARFSNLGLSGDTAWIFEYVPASRTEMAERPQRCQYEAHELTTGKRRPAPPATFGLTHCTVWAMAPRFDGPGVIALGRKGRGLLWLAADLAP